MKNREILKKILSETGRKYQNYFYNSIDMSFNNCIAECQKIIFETHPNNYEMINMFNSLISYLTNNISRYAISSFSDDKIEMLLTKMEENNIKQFDDAFLSYIEYNKKEKNWINPVEQRLYDLLNK